MKLFGKTRSLFQSFPPPWEEPGLYSWEHIQTPMSSKFGENAPGPGCHCSQAGASSDAAGVACGTFGSWKFGEVSIWLSPCGLQGGSSYTGGCCVCLSVQERWMGFPIPGRGYRSWVPPGMIDIHHAFIMFRCIREVVPQSQGPSQFGSPGCPQNPRTPPSFLLEGLVVDGGTQ